MPISVDGLMKVYGVPNDEKMFRESPIIFKNKLIQLSYALNFAASCELHLEFGVFKGKSISHLAGCRPEQQFYGFDSFEGLPEAWVRSPSSVYEAGYFAVDALPQVPKNVALIKGFFSETLDAWLEKHPGPASFVHLDVDLYSSAQFVLERLTDRIHDGTIIVFDELCDWQNSGVYPNWAQDEWRAFQEWLEKVGFGFRVLSRDIQFSAAVEIVNIDKKSDEATILKRAASLTLVGAKTETKELIDDALRLGLIGKDSAALALDQV